MDNVTTFEACKGGHPMADVRIFPNGSKYIFIYGTDDPNFQRFKELYVNPFIYPEDPEEEDTEEEEDDSVQTIYTKVYAHAKGSTYPMFTDPACLQKCLNYIKSTSGIQGMSRDVSMDVLRLLRKSNLPQK